MVIRAYCYQTKRITALLDEAEWEAFEPVVKNMRKGIKEYREEKGVGLREAFESAPSVLAAQAKYEMLTGEQIDHPDQLWIVRAALYGRCCPGCGKPFRTPKAKMCPECGYQLPNGEVAGPLIQMEFNK